MFYASGDLGKVTSTSILGTWSLTFTNNDYAVVTAPNGNTLVTNLILGDSANFPDPLTLFINAQANVPQNIYQGSVISKFQVTSNNVSLFYDDFSSTVIDSTKWAVVAEDPTNVYQIPTSAALEVSWSLPAGGYSLQSSSDLLNWGSPGLPSAVVNGQGATFVSRSMAATNPVQFFRLFNP
jgi:hypothetical protein